MSATHEDARQQVEVEAGQAARVAACRRASRGGCRRRRARSANAGIRSQDLQRPAPGGGARGPLVVVELAGLVEDAVGDAELADVVQQAGAGRRAAVAASRPSARAERDGDLGDALGVAGGVRRLGVDDAGERLGDAVQAVVVGEQQRGRRARARRRAAPSSEAQKAWSSSMALSASTSAGSNHVPRRSRATATRRARAAVLPEDLRGLREAEDPAAAARSPRLPGRRGSRGRPSARRGGGSPPRRSSSRPIMRAMSAPRSQRSSVSAARARRAVRRPALELPGAWRAARGPARSARTSGASDSAGAAGGRCRLRSRLTSCVVGAVEGGDLRRRSSSSPRP